MNNLVLVDDFGAHLDVVRGLSPKGYCLHFACLIPGEMVVSRRLGESEVRKLHTFLGRWLADQSVEGIDPDRADVIRKALSA